MRELILKKIQESLEYGDDEFVDEYGDYDACSQMSDEDLLNAYEYLVGFRG